MLAAQGHDEDVKAGELTKSSMTRVGLHSQEFQRQRFTIETDEVLPAKPSRKIKVIESNVDQLTKLIWR
jgi:hypothetical protein